MITLIAFTPSAEEFHTYSAIAENGMRHYHQIFDQYNGYEGVANVYALNQSAGNQPTKAAPELIELLLQIREWQSLYGTKANPAMGKVLGLWHIARTAGGYIPSSGDLHAAALHTNYDAIIIDQEAETVFFSDPQLKLDLGAVAKGYAAQKVSEQLREAGLDSFILNAGGNVVCGDAPRDGRSQWTVAVEDVDGFSTRLKLGMKNLSIVTSGDYQRYFEVDGKRYHHLIDPETLMPANYMRAVSIIHPNSGLADFLSTTAFLLPYEESRALIESIPDAEATWLLTDGTAYWTDGFEKLMELVK
ncbi:MAG: FAD:protein FMN transferase [Clostridia bacterium]|nr:FAD:protein FMN transferase [Clostridia bacterium]